jgi:tetratricopeptide (TPR) repeat protein
MNQTHQIIRGTIILVVAMVGMGFVFWLWWKRSRNPGMLVFRWAFSAALMSLLFWYAGKAINSGSYAAIGGVGAALVCGWVMAIVWVPPIVDAIGRAIGSLYDGGDDEVEQKPFYSKFHALRTKGKYLEALTEVRRQLDRFPTDFEGLMLLAALQAEKLDDLPGAEITVHRFCSQPDHAPLNVAYALNQLADWHLHLAKDRDAAQQALEKIIELLPETELSLQAAQRIGRLADTETLLAPHDRRRVAVGKGVNNVGLLRDQSRLKRPGEPDAEQVAAEYVKHLERHPLDGHIRERLAVLYATHYQRLDLATEQLEQLIQQPRQPAKQVVKWLDLLADLQVQGGAEAELVRATLQRIIDQYPDAAAAETTRRRLDMLNLELKAKQNKNQAVKLGSYEQNIGLKRRG